MARVTITADRHLRIVTATKLGLSGIDAAAYAYVPLASMERWLLEGSIAGRGKQRELFLAVQQAKAEFRLGVQAGLLKSAKNGNTRAAELLLRMARDAESAVSPKSSLEDPSESVDFSILTGLSDAQMAAARLMVSGVRHTTKEIAAKVGVPPGTLSHWKGDPRFAQAVYSLRQQLHRLTIQSIVQGATSGVLAQQEALRRLREHLALSDDVEDTVKLSKAINTIATSLQDRGGYPRVEKREVESTLIADAPRPHREEKTEDIRARIRLLNGGRE